MKENTQSFISKTVAGKSAWNHACICNNNAALGKFYCIGKSGGSVDFKNNKTLLNQKMRKTSWQNLLFQE